MSDQTDLNEVRYFDRAATARLLPIPSLVKQISLASEEFAAAKIVCPTRTTAPLDGVGILLSMLASDGRLAIHKLVAVQPANTSSGIPTISGTVTACSSRTGRPIFTLDAVEVTGRRTAALTVAGVAAYHGDRDLSVFLIGTGVQAHYHLEALAETWPGVSIIVKGMSEPDANRFCEQHRGVAATLSVFSGMVPSEVNTVICVTTSRQPVFDEDPQLERIVVGVGAFTPEMAEIGPKTLAGSAIYVDNVEATKVEAGDLIQAQVDWSRVLPIASLIKSGQSSRPTVLKTVGTAAWDLAAARVAAERIGISD